MKKLIIILILIISIGGVVYFVWQNKKNKYVSNINVVDEGLSKKIKEFDNAMAKVVAVDNDLDGISDADEVKYGTSIEVSDTDNDGVLDIDEIDIYKTNPIKDDTDSDGLKDGYELRRNFDPLVKNN